MWHFPSNAESRTIALTSSGTVKLAGPATFDTSKVKSDRKLEDEELTALISKPLKPSKIKKKKQTQAGTEATKEA